MKQLLVNARSEPKQLHCIQNSILGFPRYGFDTQPKLKTSVFLSHETLKSHHRNMYCQRKKEWLKLGFFHSLHIFEF